MRYEPVSLTDSISDDLRAMTAGVGAAQRQAAAAEHVIAQIAARAVAAGFAGIAAGLAQVGEVVGQARARLTAIDAILGGGNALGRQCCATTVTSGSDQRPHAAADRSFFYAPPPGIDCHLIWSPPACPPKSLSFQVSAPASPDPTWPKRIGADRSRLPSPMIDIEERRLTGVRSAHFDTSGRHEMLRVRKGLLIVAVLALAATGAVAVDLPGRTSTADAATASSAFALADPDTVHALDGTYVTYGTTVGAGVGSRCGGVGKLYVPYLNHGSGDTVSMSNCAAGDALPSGPGSWAEPGGAIWAPGVVLFNGTYYMYYSASRKGSGQKCIGLATSGGAKSPFTNKGEWACPDAGRWAIDPDPFVANGKLYVAYRDDAIASGAETGISIVQVNSSGFPIWDTRRDALKSTDIAWDTTRISGTTHVIENPSVFVGGENRFYLMFSGNNWDSARYSTGIADCGTNPLPSTRCTPIRDGVNQPFFGYTGSAGLSPYRGLPGNNQGPGAMAVFYTANNRRCVVWAWWDPATGRRYPRIGELKLDSSGFYVE